MRRDDDELDLVRATFRDQVCFLKHHLNARAIASLTSTSHPLKAQHSPPHRGPGSIVLEICRLPPVAEKKRLIVTLLRGEAPWSSAHPRIAVSHARGPDKFSGDRRKPSKNIPARPPRKFATRGPHTVRLSSA